jgi:tetratricopeptide (TPR) repeat protein
VPGAEQVRRDLLLDASEYYRRFIADAKGDPDQQSELAVVYGRLATLLDEVGTMEESLAAHEQTVKFLQQLAEQQPTSGHRQQLGVARNNLGMAYHRARDEKQAREQLNLAIDAQQSLTAADPLDEQFAADLATTYGNLGLVQLATKDIAAAEASFQAASERLQKLVERTPKSVAHLRRLAATYNNLAGLHSQRNPERAINLHHQAQRLQELAVNLDKSNFDLQRELGLTHQNLAAAAGRLERHSDAADEYARAIAVQTDLVRAVPAQQSFRRDLAVSYNNRGLAFSRMKQPRSASESFSHAAELQRQLLSVARDDAALHSSLASTLSNLGFALTQTAEVAAAKQAYEEAIAEQQQAVQLAPESSRYQALLAKHESLLAALVKNSPTRETGSGDETLDGPAETQP